jgi:hypothetical protein
MIAISNANLISPTTGIGIPQPNLALFVPGATWTFSGGNITVTDTTTITSPDTFDKSNVSISDQHGNSVIGHISAAAGNTGAISVSTLTASDWFSIQITTVSTLGVQCSGVSDYVTVATTSGTIGHWDINGVALNALT